MKITVGTPPNSLSICAAAARLLRAWRPKTEAWVLTSPERTPRSCLKSCLSSPSETALPRSSSWLESTV